MATTITLDSLSLNDATNYFAIAPWDWGDAFIAQTLFAGDLDPSSYDNVLAAGRTTREVVGNLRLKHTTPGGLNDLLQAINSKFNKASRATPITLDVLPNGATLHSFFTVFGGSAVGGQFTQMSETVFVMYVELHIICDPFIRGA